MKILALDIGGLTQDILLFDTTQTVENCIKLIMPSPTAILAQKIRAATKQKRAVFFTGFNMGGGPSKRALMAHLKSGLPAYATPQAAVTFDDDLAEVQRLGVIFVSDDEVPGNAEIIETRDLNLTAMEKTLEAFGVDPAFDAVAVAVLDHGLAPPGISDRLFRFQHLEETVQHSTDIFSFAYLAQEIPPHLTRMKAVAQSMERNLPLLLMDTPVAAAIGAAEDGNVGRHAHRLIVNVGNFHTLAFHLRGNEILGLFEHHTGRMDANKLDDMIGRLVRGDLTGREVYEDGGHGALVVKGSEEAPFVVVTGPRRHLMGHSALSPYWAAPYGDMMLTGCFGLVRAFARRVEPWQGEIAMALRVD